MYRIADYLTKCLVTFQAASRAATPEAEEEDLVHIHEPRHIRDFYELVEGRTHCCSVCQKNIKAASTSNLIQHMKLHSKAYEVYMSERARYSHYKASKRKFAVSVYGI